MGLRERRRPALSVDVEQWLSRPSDCFAQARLLRRIGHFKNIGEYEEVVVTGSSLNLFFHCSVKEFHRPQLRLGEGVPKIRVGVGLEIGQESEQSPAHLLGEIRGKTVGEVSSVEAQMRAA